VLSAVTAVPDARKGERLILVTQKQGASRSEFQAFARSRGASELMIPAEIVTMDKLPLLGSGKVDLVTLGRMMRERATAATAPQQAAVGA
jgi:acyl-[acyl-carrier-protein]-phospholipid O-acyltransferase/long-chain-fatty-acid--[acyl-carrier-protein] ligase